MQTCIFTHLILFPRNSSKANERKMSATLNNEKAPSIRNVTDNAASIEKTLEAIRNRSPAKITERRGSPSQMYEKAPSLINARDNTAAIEKTLEAIRNRSPTKINERQTSPTQNYEKASSLRNVRDNNATIDASKNASAVLLDTTFIEDPEAEKSKYENDFSKKPNGEAEKTYSKWRDNKLCSPVCTKTQETQNTIDRTRPNENKSLKDPALTYSKWVMDKSPYKQSSTKDLHVEGVAKRIEPRTATDANKSKANSFRNSLTADGISNTALHSRTTGINMADNQALHDQTTQKTDDRNKPCHCCACHQAQMTTCFNPGDSRPSSPRSGCVPLINHTVTYTLCQSECSSTCESYRGKS